ncbi:transcriptional regulator with XRE-family HTH domain [Paraburkholderia sp. BL23I1N1]|uniref:helix-turn-helix domain-containing protein n=1 Tax=unclassified Paraburkholderia TaxID=2615204 RepID=UPI000AE50FCF|nr:MULTISPECIES: helix-turn-helix transcriptional regulator [unclassified Paraburkholderia]REE18590.1 transcriptional regulator with XRE-family HTH domain [Paraburkholderia sp. BL27I4N3]RKE35604.1 transcriptional regulator with XRE-family HTH domain [Paraburkholderia sp. BL23I1N1]TCK94669.1 transcriptional regulator with XRE-family HTH domain [Paraburkholderia sp. BL9I2N2]
MSSTTDHGDYHQRVAQVREHLGLSQDKMARQLGLSLRAYANYERGERAVPVELLRALYEQFSVDPVWLMTGDGNMILDRDVHYRLDQKTLDSVLVAVARIEQRLDVPLDAKKKARLIGLLYEQCQLLGESAEQILKDSRISRLAR